MNHEQEKLKSSIRRHRDSVAVKKQLKIAKNCTVYSEKSNLIKEPHRMHKRHAMDCGTPKCNICGNPRSNKLFKFTDRLTIQERRFLQDMDITRDKHSNGLLPNRD